MKRRSVSTPIVLASVAVALSIALLVGWTVFLLRSGNTTIMLLGIVSFVIIMGVIVLSAFFLVREIIEVRRQTTFIDAVTHELKSPLASLRLCAETMARPQLDAERREELRRMMLDDLSRLGGVVDAILDATRLSAGRGPNERRAFELRPVIDESVATIAARHQVPAERFTVRGQVEGELLGDRRALRTVIENLLDNAIKYSGAEPAIEVAIADQSPDRVEITIRDRGIGIDRRDLRRVFQRFYRAPEEEVRARHGTGLGLYIVRALVRSMGGRIRAHSEGRGQGATFAMWLPRG